MTKVSGNHVGKLGTPSQLSGFRRPAAAQPGEDFAAGHLVAEGQPPDRRGRIDLLLEDDRADAY